MKKFAVVAASALTMLLIFVVGTQFSGIVTAQNAGTENSSTINRTITVTGEGTVTTTPDVLKAELGAVSFQFNLEAALAEANAKMAALLEALKAQGISENDIQTSQFNVSLQRENYLGPITGYQVSNTVRVTIRDLDAAGRILDEAIKAGANEIYGVYFAIEDKAALAEQARQAAVANAMSKAGQIAAAAGVQLGQVLTISSDVSSFPLYAERAQFTAADGAVPLQPGQSELGTTVQVVFEIK